jgi:hypothetical protein
MVTKKGKRGQDLVAPGRFVKLQQILAEHINEGLVLPTLLMATGANPRSDAGSSRALSSTMFWRIFSDLDAGVFAGSAPSGSSPVVLQVPRSGGHGGSAVKTRDQIAFLCFILGPCLQSLRIVL